MKLKPWHWVGLTAILVLAAAATYQLRSIINPEEILAAPLDPTCDLRKGPCLSRLPDGRSVELGIEPRQIPPLQPLEVKVRVTHIDADAVEIDFNGVDMNMGYNRPRLRATGKGEFSGKAVLSVCVRNRMLWEARVLVHTDEGVIAAPYRFETTVR